MWGVGCGVSEEGPAGFFFTTFPLSNERQRRPMAAAIVDVLGGRGDARVTEATRLSRNTLIAGAEAVQACETTSADLMRI